MFALKSTLIVMIVLIGLLSAVSFSSIATLGDCPDSHCATAQSLRQAWYKHDKSDGPVPPYAIAGGVKIKP